MRVLRALFIAPLTAFVGCLLAFFVADYLTRLAHVPEMEGQRGMTIFFLCVPLGILSKTGSLRASIGNEPVASQFIELKISPAPRKEDETWSDWIFATQRVDLSPVSEPERMELRYRVLPMND